MLAELVKSTGKSMNQPAMSEAVEHQDERREDAPDAPRVEVREA